MISPAFWLVRGNEFKITRSDDPIHTPLLRTTGNCLGSQTFRSKEGSGREHPLSPMSQCLKQEFPILDMSTAHAFENNFFSIKIMSVHATRL